MAKAPEKMVDLYAATGMRIGGKGVKRGDAIRVATGLAAELVATGRARKDRPGKPGKPADRSEG